jgi:hypothetical protein
MSSRKCIGSLVVTQFDFVPQNLFLLAAGFQPVEESHNGIEEGQKSSVKQRNFKGLRPWLPKHPLKQQYDCERHQKGNRKRGFHLVAWLIAGVLHQVWWIFTKLSYAKWSETAAGKFFHFLRNGYWRGYFFKTQRPSAAEPQPKVGKRRGRRDAEKKERRC